ncbi:hypothetical protein MWG07_12130 [Fusobacterium necrophorum]|uniref:Uncharacterized protein n=3 Tax=Fusobacterium TaxID=848 RepID=A0AAN4ATK3_9FUSO|nr:MULTISPECIES: hypothetical protein [Fusobacterium]EJU18499.1 hypothetical protein HMPREF1127_1782 [Fusobacterium necrophorum subsp. funduliforme Fnf 1007]KXA17096.1 hypothetical protein HMPREF3206_00048 [Fusobacterium equinum]KYM57069.1 hypothetical protein A2U07_01465 [Fusobacterium necrophorum subsp. funduliforme]MDK4475465.1 hypothetical protein [Fusobacterium necrophorum]MDK4481885.1 hypothetical protein [Fusobacterium necrophorum]
MNDIMTAFQREIQKHSQKSTFDFKSYEISEVDIATVSEQENIFFNSFRKYRKNMYSMCEALSVIETTLKATNSFMAWYEAAGLSKDMVSVMLKRWNLFKSFKEYKDKIFSLSDQAIKILTHKDVLYDDTLAILQGDVTKAQDIKQILEPVMENNSLEFKKPGQKYFNFKKVQKIEKRLKKIPDEEIDNFKNELREYIKELQELLKYRRYDMSKTDDENQHTIDEML